MEKIERILERYKIYIGVKDVNIDNKALQD
jgi:hypothetical protein